MNIGAKLILPKIDPRIQLEKDLRKAKLAANKVIAEIIEANFMTLIESSAQKYGSYVASWKVSLGRRGSASGHENWEPPGGLDPDMWYARGSTPAISWATRENASVWDQIATYAVNSTAFFPAVVVYNNSPHADVAEGGPLRRENRGAEGSFERFQEAVQAAFNVPIII